MTIKELQDEITNIKILKSVKGKDLHYEMWKLGFKYIGNDNQGYDLFLKIVGDCYSQAKVSKTGHSNYYTITYDYDVGNNPGRLQHWKDTLYTLFEIPCGQTAIIYDYHDPEVANKYVNSLIKDKLPRGYYFTWKFD